MIGRDSARRRRGGGAIALLCLLACWLFAAPTARAELDEEERAWIARCVESLDATSENVRAGAVNALERLGPGAVPTIVRASSRISTDDGWLALGRALQGMGSDGTDALEASRPEWPTEATVRLETLLGELSAVPDPPEPDAEIDAKIRAALEPFRGSNRYTHNDARVGKIVALGRDAVPTLLNVLKKESGFGGDFAVRMAVTDALRSLAEDEDVPALRAAALDGSGPAMKVLGSLGSPSAIEALLTCIDRQGMSFDLGEALEPHVGDERVVPAVNAWLEKNMASGDWRVAAAAGLLEVAADPSSVDVLIRALDHTNEPQTMLRVGKALIALQREEGVGALVDVAGAPPRTGPGSGLSMQVSAAMRLNEIAGRKIFTGSRVVRPNADEENAEALKAAAAEFRTWWEQSQGGLDLAAPTKNDGAFTWAGSTLRVLGADGTPVNGAHVWKLGIAGSMMDGTWLPSHGAPVRSRLDGVATLPTRNDRLCALANHEGFAAFVCDAAAGADGHVTLRLEGATVVHGTVVGPDGRPLEDVRLRVRLPGGYEWHHVDADVAVDGGFRVLPLPDGVIARARGQAYVEIQADGIPETRVPLDTTTTYPLRIELERARPIRGVVIGADGRDVKDAMVMLGNGIDPDPVPVSDHGTFELGSAPAGLREIVVVAASHAPLRVAVPAGRDAVDLGEIELPAGKPLRGKIREVEGDSVKAAWVALWTQDEVRVATCDVGTDGTFELPHVGDGPHHMDVYVHRGADSASWRHTGRTVEAGGEALTITIPHGVEVRLTDAAGKPHEASEVSVELRFASGETYTEHFQGGNWGPFSRIRVPAARTSTFTAVVVVDGGDPITVEDVDADPDGNADVDVLVK